MLRIDDFGPPRKRPGQSEFVKLRRVPIQPPETPFDRVWMGSELGYLSFSGDKPRPSDSVTIVGQPPNQVVLSVGDPVQQDPIFVEDACKCKCPTGAGTAFYLAPIGRNSVVAAIDPETAAFYQLFGLGNLWFGRGLAVDTEAPHDLYVLDDRRALQTRVTNAAPVGTRNYFSVARFTTTGGQYLFADYVNLTDPTPAAQTPGSSLFDESTEEDPPNFTTNGLAVVASECTLTMFKAPSRYLLRSGTSLVTHTLTRDGGSYDRGLRGNIVTVPDKPAKASLRYVIAVTSGGDYELLEFNADDEITRILALEASPPPRQLASLCNRLLILSTSTAYNLQSEETIV